MSYHSAVCVLTARGLDRMLKEGGSQAWKLAGKRASTYMYCVCVQNRREPNDWGNATAPDREAFMVGKISRVLLVPPPPEDPEEKRYMLQFSEYAEVSLPDAWNGQRNPVQYTTLEEMGIDIRKLKFKPMPEVAEQIVPIAQPSANGLSIEEAKKGLAQRFGVKLEQIQITINA